LSNSTHAHEASSEETFCAEVAAVHGGSGDSKTMRVEVVNILPFLRPHLFCHFIFGNHSHLQMDKKR